MTTPALPPGDLCRRPKLQVFGRLLVLLLLLISGINPNPGPTTSASRRSAPLPPVGILSWNCNGLKNSSKELASFLSSRQVKIACIQETKLNASSKSPSFPNYAIVRRDRPVGGGGGLITLVHHSIPFVEKPSPLNDPTETILIEAEIKRHLRRRQCVSTSAIVVSSKLLGVPPTHSCWRLYCRRRHQWPQRIVVGGCQRHSWRFDCRRA